MFCCNLLIGIVLKSMILQILLIFIIIIIPMIEAQSLKENTTKELYNLRSIKLMLINSIINFFSLCGSTDNFFSQDL